MAKTLEQEFQEIEEIIDKMEAEGVPLEESFTLYEKGMKKLKSATNKISSVEKKVAELREDGSLEEIDDQEED